MGCVEGDWPIHPRNGDDPRTQNWAKDAPSGSIGSPTLDKPAFEVLVGPFGGLLRPSRRKMQERIDEQAEYISRLESTIHGFCQLTADLNKDIASNSIIHLQKIKNLDEQLQMANIEGRKLREYSDGLRDTIRLLSAPKKRGRTRKVK